jgi:hypothetical protein
MGVVYVMEFYIKRPFLSLKYGSEPDCLHEGLSDLQSLERARDPLRKARVEMKTGEGNSRMVKGFLKMVWLGRKPMFIQQEAS